MTEEVETLVRQLSEDNGCTIKSLEIYQNDFGYRVVIDSEGNPFENDNDKVVYLTCRECKYRSISQGEYIVDENNVINWCCSNESYDEYVDAPSDSKITLIFSSNSNSKESSIYITDVFERLLIEDIKDDLRMTSIRMKRLDRSLNSDETSEILNQIKIMMRDIL